MKAAIFDLDGTIADTLCDLADAVNGGLREIGYPEHSCDEYRYMVGNGAWKLCERALPDEHKDETPELHRLFSVNYGRNFLDKTRLYDGIHEVMVRLSEAGVKLAVATNKPEEFAELLIGRLLPDIPFVRVLGGRRDRPSKPDIQMIAEVLAALPDEDCEAYMIGDSNVDIQTGRNAGIHTIGCAWGFRGRSELEAAGAEFVIDKPEEIVSIIRNS